MSFYATNGYTADCPPLIEIQCEHMSLRMEGNTLFQKSADGAWKEIPVEQLNPLGKSYWGAGHTVCIADFYRCITENIPFSLELPNVEETVRLMLMVYRSAAEGKTIVWEE